MHRVALLLAVTVFTVLAGASATRGAVADTSSSSPLSRSVQAHMRFLASDVLLPTTDPPDVEPIRWLANSDFTPAWKPGMRP